MLTSASQIKGWTRIISSPFQIQQCRPLIVEFPPVRISWTHWRSRKIDKNPSEHAPAHVSAMKENLMNLNLILRFLHTTTKRQLIRKHLSEKWLRHLLKFSLKMTALILANYTGQWHPSHLSWKDREKDSPEKLSANRNSLEVLVNSEGKSWFTLLPTTLGKR